ncbi:MAG TPA: hypothetical protein PKI11_02865 [Candidatus Hydrogenedentes bacterium]|nr:hypothetical protein [Candidatus Hydrogenedentota bacterium]
MRGNTARIEDEAMREFDELLGGLHPVAANKRPGKKKEKKKVKRAASGKAAAETATAKGAAAKKADRRPKSVKKPPEPAPPVATRATSAPVAKTPPAPPAKPARPAVTNVIGELDRLRAELLEQREVRAALETRLREAESRLRQAEAYQAAPASAPAPEAGLHDLGIFAPPAAAAKKPTAEFAAFETWLMEAELRTSDAEGEFKQSPGVSRAALMPEDLADSQMAAQLSSTRLAIEAAEARAAYNARQVKKLTEELAEARAAQIRAEARIRALEGRVQQAQTQAGLLDKFVEPEALAHEPPPWALDRLEQPIAVEEEAVEEAAVVEEEAVEAEAEHGLEIGPRLDESPIAPLESAPVVEEAEVADELAAALEEWGMQESEAIAVAETEEAAPSPTAEADVGARLPGEEEGEAEAETPSAPSLEIERDEASLAEALEDWGKEVAEEEPPPSAPSVEPPPEAKPRRHTGRESMAEALGLWGGRAPSHDDAEASEQPREEGQPPSDAEKKSGKDAMVDALLRFMGPGS